MKKSIMMFGFLATLTRALFSPINCAGDYGTRLINDTTSFVSCVVGNVTTGADNAVTTTPDIV